jgi:hypothetical protein
VRTAIFLAALAAALTAGGNVAAALPGANYAQQPPLIRAVRAKADAYVSVAKRSENFGGSRGLRVDAAPITRAYLRFKADIGSADVAHVSLLVYSRTRSRTGFQVRLVYDPWREKKITFQNAPMVSSDFIRSGPLKGGMWNVVDLTPLADRAAMGEGVSLGLTTRSPNALDLASRESGVRGPRLVVERVVNQGGGPGMPPTEPTPPAADPAPPADPTSEQPPVD